MASKFAGEEVEAEAKTHDNGIEGGDGSLERSPYRRGWFRLVVIAASVKIDLKSSRILCVSQSKEKDDLDFSPSFVDSDKQLLSGHRERYGP